MDRSAVAVADQMIARMRIRTERLADPSTQPARRPTLLILDEPTFGVDAGGRGERTEQRHEFQDADAATLVMSPKPDERLVVSDRLRILCDATSFRTINDGT